MATKNTHWRIIRRIGWTILIIASLLVTVLIIVGVVMHKPRPEGKTGPEADALARNMMAAVNAAAWDSVNVVHWNFGGRFRHTWDRKRMYDEVSWGDNRVLINLTNRSGIAYVNGEEVGGNEKEKLLLKAWERWVNDAFWLNPVVKAFDEGTSRAVVELEEGGQALLVSYSSGGVTPGDAYLWELDENNRPVAWQMWVKIIPVGGLRFTWDGWQQTSEGAWLSTVHEGPFTLKMTNLKTAASVTELSNGIDIFAPLE